MHEDTPKLRVTSVSPVSPHNEDLYEVGKKMLFDSLDIGREFSKFMISLSTGAIPIYIGLLSLLKIETGLTFIYFIPPLVFILSAAFFVMSYFPRRGEYSLDIVDEIEKARDHAITSRSIFI